MSSTGFRPSSLLGKKKEDEEAILKSYKSYTETDDTEDTDIPAAVSPAPPTTLGFEGVQPDNAAVANPQEIEMAESHMGAPTDKEDQPLHEGHLYPNLLAQTDDDELPESPAKKDDNKVNDLFFKDGKRRIDFVLAYRKQESEEREEKRVKKRQNFEANLIDEGLQLEYENSEGPEPKEDDPESHDGRTFFVKVHAPWDLMTRYAEELKIKMPIEENNMEEPVNVFNCIDKLWTPFELSEEYVKPEPDVFTAPFIRDRASEFIMESQDTFFPNNIRNRVVYEILERMRYDANDPAKFGIDHLIANGSYFAAYPLHEGDYKSKHSLLTHGPQNDRHLPAWARPNFRNLLYEEWARPGRWYKKQPLDLIRRYFGEKIGIYFCWLGFYTEMLTWAGFVGLIVFLYGCISLPSSVVVQEICDGTDIIMCPLCDRRCPYWTLSDSCFYSKLTYLFDNEATVFFACFMSLWATMFCEFWKRRQNTIDYDWDLFGFEEQEENIRPEFEAKAPDRRVSPITNLPEKYMKFSKRFPRFSTSVLTIAFMILLVMAAVMTVIVYRIVVKTAIFAIDQEFISSYASIITSVTASMISLILIMILQILYERIAVWLTNLELHRTETEYEDSFTFKMYLFAFVNYYSTSFYIAFFKGRLPGTPADYGRVFGIWRQEECDPAGCMQELFINIAITMCGKQFFNNFMELAMPVLMNFWRSRTGRKEEKSGKGRYEQWEQDADLADLGPRGLFKEYLEMVVQFGFSTIFVAAFPLAPLFALLNNLVEVRLDAYKFISQLRRPVAKRAQDIGAWYAILVTVGNLSVLTNALVIAFTSEFIPRQVFKYYYGGPEATLNGYTNWSLSYFNTVDMQNDSKPTDPSYPRVGDEDTTDPNYGLNVSVCRYRGNYDEHYNVTLDYWLVIAIKLAFILLYEHVIIFVKMVVAYVIPDMPDTVKNQIKRENFLAQQALHELTLSKGMATKSQEAAMPLGASGMV
ncbi:anoctamin-4-like isoform X4 [Strongylocentrotus purpuratus]|uniref:Anoctamin n=1 Tax=Strongylocentrotus purpuratus TaxID=7668 RepID=A0A7M7P0E4_STRPU|nr:anoctamin-4-like isoform X4 [Strongylocentrotus purpuratus]